MKISPARIAAFDILIKIYRDRAFSSVLLPVYEENLSPADGGLCHELVLGVLRRRYFLDSVLSRHTKVAKLDAEVLVALEIGLYQILFLDRVPSYSAVSDSVSLVQRARKSSAKGLVNAILRKPVEDLVPEKFDDPLRTLAVETSHPELLIEKWVRQFGFAETESLAKANNTEPNAAFRQLKESAEPRGDDVTPSRYVEGCFITRRLSPKLKELAVNGDIYLQDEGSQLVAQSIEVGKGESFLDACAAPGGKTTQIARRYIGVAGPIIAGDRYPKRVRFLKENISRQHLEVPVVQFDAETALPFGGEVFDVIFIDAPCSGTGTIRHNPEIRYFIEESDFGRFSLKQLAMLETASNHLKRGGRLIYSTCSLETEENEEVCEAFLSRNGDLFKKAEPAMPTTFRTPDGNYRTFPHRDDMDGFFVASFVKR